MPAAAAAATKTSSFRRLAPRSRTIGTYEPEPDSVGSGWNCSPTRASLSFLAIREASLSAPTPSSASAAPAVSKLIELNEYGLDSWPRAGVGSNGSQPQPGNHTSTQAWALRSVTVHS